VARNHTFVDGHERAAVLPTAVVAELNGRRFDPDQVDEVRRTPRERPGSWTRRRSRRGSRRSADDAHVRRVERASNGSVPHTRGRGGEMVDEPRGLRSWLATREPLAEPFPDVHVDEPDVWRSPASTTVGP